MRPSEDIVLLNLRQGTQEWLNARAGITTASTFEDAMSVLTKKSGDKLPGDPTSVSDRLCCDTAVEIISGKPFGENPKNWILERGHQLEDSARMLYETRRNTMVEEFGFIHTTDKSFGYSTDGLVDDDGLIEIKCPIDSTKILRIWETGDIAEYLPQMQGGLWLTGRKWCDFLMYVPDLANVKADLYIQRVFRDEAYIEDMQEKLLAFRLRVQTKVELLRLIGAKNA